VTARKKGHKKNGPGHEARGRCVRLGLRGKAMCWSAFALSGYGATSLRTRS
jgi:hypothetical protein